MPDGLLLTGLGVLISSTVLVWSAAGLSALLATGSWPEGVSIGRSALAVRALIGDPADPAAAWPATDAAAMARPGLFWGVFVGQLMVLFTLALFAMSALARRRARRDAHRRGLTTPPASEGPAAAMTHPQPVETVPPAAPAPPIAPVPAARPASEPAPPAVEEPAAQEVTAPPVPEATEATEATAPMVRPDRGTSGTLLLRADHDPRDAVRDAEGALVVVTSDPALWQETVGAREKLGPTHLYDPTHRADAPHRLRWSPEHGCADMAVARARATALLTPVRSPARIDATTHEAAETILRCSLHAAAVGGQPFRQVHRWIVSGTMNEAVRILRKGKSATSGAAGELEAMLISHPGRRDAATELIRSALGALSQLHVRDSCAAGKADTLVWESFVPEGGTLYVMGESIEDPRRSPGAMPLVTALTADVVEHGRRMAAGSSSGRLDPPVTLVLDGPATVAPLPLLPALLTPETAATGLHTHAYVRSHAQVRAWWPDLIGALNNV
ncbi:type VI secretion protein [Streptomyces sp. OF8]|uniref:Type VI secretion protein n=1 Tax=Streptomyces alkaliterrae TaxID=2213162 RepID=A0A7W3ZUG1_9ACTN|nr:type VI secretion protein [Streptomyces alkaliterrae]